MLSVRFKRPHQSPADRGDPDTSPKSCLRSTLPAEITSPSSLLSLAQKLSLHASVEWGSLTNDSFGVSLLRQDELAKVGRVPNRTMDEWPLGRKGHAAAQEHRIFTSQLGHQAGCGNAEFRNRPLEIPHRVEGDARSAARLIRALAGRTLCIAGDSVDRQFFHAATHGFHRLLDEGPTACEFPGGLNITAGKMNASCIHTPTTKYYGVLTAIPFVEARSSSGTLLGRVRYLQLYSDEANVYDVIDQLCDVVSLQYSFHWSQWDYVGRIGKRYYLPAVEGGMAFLTNFSAGGKVAIWRGTTPRHFMDGKYVAERDGSAAAACVPYVPACPLDEQTHSTLVRAIAARMANNAPPLPQAVINRSHHPKFPRLSDVTAAEWAPFRLNPCDRPPSPKVHGRGSEHPVWYDMTVISRGTTSNPDSASGGTRTTPRR